MRNSPHFQAYLVLLVILMMFLWSGLYVLFGGHGWTNWFTAMIMCGVALFTADGIVERVFWKRLNKTFNLNMVVVSEITPQTLSDPETKRRLQGSVESVLQELAVILAYQTAKEDSMNSVGGELRWIKEHVKLAKCRFWRAYGLARIFGFQVKLRWKDYVGSQAI